MRRGSRYTGYDDDRIKKIIYLSGGILAIGILIFTISYMLYGNSNSEIDTEQFAYLNTNVSTTSDTGSEEASSQIGRSVYEMQNSTEENVISENTAVNNVTSTESTASAVNETELGEETEIAEIKEANPDPTFIMPCSGNILREFAKDKFVYSDTLKEWIAHYGIDIQADSTSVVKASEAGTIQSIKSDPRYGLTVVVSHENGFTTVYSNLATAEFVVEGEQVEEGQTIGTIGNTATFEILDDSHLHFELLKDGEYVDPEIYCK